MYCAVSLVPSAFYPPKGEPVLPTPTGVVGLLGHYTATLKKVTQLKKSGKSLKKKKRDKTEQRATPLLVAGP